MFFRWNDCFNKYGKKCNVIGIWGVEFESFMGCAAAPRAIYNCCKPDWVLLRVFMYVYMRSSDSVVCVRARWINLVEIISKTRLKDSYLYVYFYMTHRSLLLCVCVCVYFTLKLITRDWPSTDVEVNSFGALYENISNRLTRIGMNFFRPKCPLDRSKWQGRPCRRSVQHVRYVFDVGNRSNV